MRNVRRLALVLCLTLVGVACSSSKSTSSTGGSTPAKAQELRAGFTDDQYVVEGPDAALGAYPLNTNVVETLTYLSPTYEVKPMLAERWEFHAPNTWRFFLRPNVKFHDGQPFTAQAVKEGLFDRVAKQDGGGTILAGPNSAVVVDPLTIDFTPTGPDLRVPEQIVHPSNAAYAPGSDPGKKPVGTGPFRFVSYQPKEQIVVERNPDYWGTKAKLDKMTFRFYPDASARRLALEAGDIDFAFDVPRPDVEGLKSKGFTVQNSSPGAYEAMYANIHGAAPHDILSDVKVRQAIDYAIDRKAVVTGVLDGQATTDQTFVPSAVLAPHQSMVQGFSYDPTKAKSMLDDAGWKPGSDGIREKNGRKLKITLVSGFPSSEAIKPMPTFLQSQLKGVGIDVDIVERPDSASYQALIDNGSGDLYIEQGNQNDANPAFLPVLLFYAGGTGASASYQSLFAPKGTFDQIMGQTLTESDPQRVRELTAQGMHQIIDVDSVVMPLAGIYRIYGMSKSVQGFTPHPSFLNVRWEGVSLK